MPVTFSKLAATNEWGVRIQDEPLDAVVVGAHFEAVRKDGRKVPVVIDRVIWSSRIEGVALCTILPTPAEPRRGRRHA